MSNKLRIVIERGGIYRFIEAKRGRTQVGYYELNFSEDYRTCNGGVLRSKESNAGIPRAMINKAQQEINRIAKRKGSPIRHEERTVTRKGEKLMPHIFQEFGYRRFRREDGYSTLVKIYRP